MAFDPTAFKRFEGNGGVWDASNNCIKVDNPHLLTQIAGYAKFDFAQKHCLVYFRGQPALFGSMRAALYRPNKSFPKINTSERHKLLREYMLLHETSNSFLNNTPRNVHEPLLQHYGVKTRWLDIVDNIWVALWFACYSANVCGKYGEFLYFERRSLLSRDQCCYVVLLGFEDLANSADPGVMENQTYTLADLRMAAPSLFIRPHAQHGLVVRKKKVDNFQQTDCSAAIIGTIKVGLQDALAWIGSGLLLSSHVLFPPPYFDRGYRQLLETAPRSEVLGSVQAVGP